MRPLFATTFTLATVAGLCTIPTFAAQGDVVWFRFKKSFIQSSYPTAIAFGTIDAGSEWTLGPAHTIAQARACGGKDGEVHIGIYEGDLPWPASGREFSYPVGIQRSPGGWSSSRQTCRKTT